MAEMWSQELYARAWRFAGEAHLGQTVPGTQLPYVVHLGLVCMEVMAALRAEPEAERDENLAVGCALLHDVVEDTPLSAEEVRTAFGPSVAAGVLALSKDAALPREEQMADSLRRIREQPREVWLVKLADRITNLAPPPPNWDRTRIAAYRTEAQEILRALGEASPTLAGRLAAKIEAYAAFL